MVALRRAVGQEPGARGAVGLGGELLGALERRRRRAEVDAVDVLRDVELERLPADRGADAEVGAVARLVAGDVEAGRAAEPVRDDRVEVRRRGLVGRGHNTRQHGTMRVVVVTREYVDVPVGERAMRTFVAAPAASGSASRHRLLHRHLPAHRPQPALGGAARGLRVRRRRARDLPPDRARRAPCSTSTTRARCAGRPTPTRRRSPDFDADVDAGARLAGGALPVGRRRRALHGRAHRVPGRRSTTACAARSAGTRPACTTASSARTRRTRWRARARSTASCC